MDKNNIPNGMRRVVDFLQTDIRDLNEGKRAEKNVRIIHEQLRAFFSFRCSDPDWRETGALLRSCFETYLRMVQTGRRLERADIVLKAWYRQDGLLEDIRKLRRFTDRIEQEPPELVLTMGYSNYVFFFRQRLGKMKQAYQQAAPTAGQPERKYRTQDLCRFLERECGNSSLRSLPKAYADCGMLLAKAENGQPLTDEDKKLIGGIEDTLNNFIQCILKGYPKRELEQLARKYDGRIAAMQKEIREGLALYQALTAFFTDEWFGRLDPAVIGRPLPPGEVSRLYRAALYADEAEAILRDFPEQL